VEGLQLWEEAAPITRSRGKFYFFLANLLSVSAANPSKTVISFALGGSRCAN